MAFWDFFRRRPQSKPTALPSGLPRLAPAARAPLTVPPAPTLDPRDAEMWRQWRLFRGDSSHRDWVMFLAALRQRHVQLAAEIRSLERDIALNTEESRFIP